MFSRARRWLRPPRTLRPTRAGWSFFALCFGVGFAALNTGNNLLYLVMALMLAFLVLSGVLSEADYLRIIRQKTATFMSACCRIGGLAGGLAADAVEALTTYGERIGIAFQIIDDSLDFAADPTRLRGARDGQEPRCLTTAPPTAW